jgi:hypothetical protein
MWHVLGDSFLNAANYIDGLKTIVGNANISMNKDGAGGTSLTDQADRLEADPGNWNRLLIIDDGGFDGTAPQGIAAVERMRACLNAAGHDRWLYMEPQIHATVTLGSPTRAGTEAKHAAMAEYCGDRFVPMHAATLAAAISDPEDPGYAGDQEDVANGVAPRSLRQTDDPQHPNAAGHVVRKTELKLHMQGLGWI